MNAHMTEWFGGHQFPLIFMIDDLANIAFKHNHGDWGFLQSEPNSFYEFVNNEFLKLHPKLKFTFFVVSGKRSIHIDGCYDEVEDCQSNGFPVFLQKLQKDGHEIAYHGLHHGENINGKFVQEWSTFSSETIATEVTGQGKLKLEGATGSEIVNGGKYCGYEPGKYGHTSIVRNSFRWWFDLWDDNELDRPTGEWKDGIFYFPSNIDCSVYSANLLGRVPFRKYLTSQRKAILNGSCQSRLSNLISNKGIVTLQEHTSPIRTDGKIQYPNVFHDKPQILEILDFCNKHEPWFATATEVYSYQLIRTNLQLVEKNESIYLEYIGSELDYQFLIDRKVEITLNVVGLSVVGELKSQVYMRGNNRLLNVGLGLFLDNFLIISQGTSQ
jgi:hypothetical protein